MYTRTIMVRLMSHHLSVVVLSPEHRRNAHRSASFAQKACSPDTPPRPEILTCVGLRAGNAVPGAPPVVSLIAGGGSQRDGETDDCIVLAFYKVSFYSSNGLDTERWLLRWL